tara:strand:- start:742 stop:1092 length:351 start_codon:yes stop_codon:yes gene_type:complete
MQEDALRQYMMMLMPNAANTNYMQPNQEAMLNNQSISPYTPQGGVQMPNQTGIAKLLEMISSGDPDGMTAPQQQLTQEQIIARQQAYAQQEMMKKMTGEQLQQRDDSIFDRMLGRR